MTNFWWSIFDVVQRLCLYLECTVLSGNMTSLNQHQEDNSSTCKIFKMSRFKLDLRQKTVSVKYTWPKFTGQKLFSVCWSGNVFPIQIWDSFQTNNPYQISSDNLRRQQNLKKKSQYFMLQYRLFFLRLIAQFFTQIYMNHFVSS